MAGIAFLRRLLMKQAMKKSEDASGILSLNKGLANDVDTTVKKWIESAKKQGQDIDKMGEQEIKYIVELNKPKGPMIGEHRVIDATSPEGEILTRDLFNMLDRQSGKNVIKTDFGGGVTDIVTETITKIKVMKPIDGMKEANSVLARKGKYKNLTEEQSQKIIKDTEDHIFERNVDVDPEDFAHGGRTGSGLNYLLGEDDQNSRVPYSKGSGKRESWTDKITRWGGGPSMIAGDLGFEGLHQIYNLLGMGGLYAEGGRTGFGLGGMSKRLFLKLMGGTAAGTVAAKTGLFSLLKGGATKSVIKDLTSVPIKSGVDGMPLWFKPLVNKVIKEGDDVTKKFATADREIVHQVSIEGKIGKDALGVEDVRVTQNLDEGTIRVEYNSPDAMGESGVDLLYKKGEEIPIKKKGKNTSVKEKDEFTASEDDFYPQQTSPDGDFDLEFTENIVKNVDDLYSDTSKLKQFATGEKLTIKEISDATKKKNYIKEVKKNPNDHAFGNVTGDDHPLGYGLGEKKIINMIKKTKPIKRESGGRVPLKFGKMPESKDIDTGVTKLDIISGARESQKLRKLLNKLREDRAQGGRVPLAGGNTPSDTQLEQYYRNLEEEKKRRRLQRQLYDQRFGIGSGPVLEASQGGLAGLLGE